MALQEPIHWCERRKPDGTRLARWIEDCEQGGEHRDACKESDDHSRAGDLPELRQATIIGWHEGGEAARRGGCGKRQWTARLHCRAVQSGTQVFIIVAFGPVSDTELDAEIDADADKEDEEPDGEQVQC